MMTIIGTHTGILIDINNIKLSDIELIDIAHGLAKEQRFGRTMPCNVRYSVAQHSYLMANFCLEILDDIDLAKKALLHDASEAYLGDIPTGLKACLPDYKRIESYLMDLILERFNIKITEDDHKKLKKLDKNILLDEALVVLPHRYSYFKQNNPGSRPLGVDIQLTNDEQAVKSMYLLAAKVLGV